MGATTSCSTARGFGRDVEKTGDKIQEAATQ
ncbi:MAG: entericidin A/B family lipoprotein [Verrucomicrobiota bacterium]